MVRKKHPKNYRLFSNYSFHIPGVSGMFGLLGLFLLGALIGNIVSLVVAVILPGISTEYIELICYPFMFIPPMIYTGYKSSSNMLFESGIALDSKHFGRPGGPAIAGIVMLATICVAFMVDAIMVHMPEMPEYLENILKSLTGGNFWIDLICVSIMAPFFEEWLCRGMVLRGLLNYKRTRKDGETVNGIKPVWAIVISSLFFAFIHMNPWQAVPAFLLGCLFGYVYYKTGSLKLTMLMHFTNNTFALICSQIDSLKDMDSWLDVMPGADYWVVFLASGLVLALVIYTLYKIELVKPQGNSDVIEP